MTEIFIHRDSILKNPPSDLPLANIILFDAISYAADTAVIAYVRLRTSLGEFVATEKKDLLQLYPCYLDAWAIVDSIDKLLALINKNTKEMQ
ncbi:hypothetical protein [Comamonas sp.]|uniref:hypothetical protein n=1 Tax=Comamonas sp. TaxID=34028 RepID=UPI00289D45FC|nr:hypothetical protein [Comamonas sp.]